MSVAVGVVTALTAAGLGLLVHAFMSALAEWAGRLTAGRFRRSLETVMRRPSPDSTLEEISRLPRNLALWMLGCAAAGLLMTMALIPDGPMRFAGLMAGIAPLAWKYQRLRVLRQEIRKGIADLLENVRLRLAFGGSLTHSLLTLAESSEEGLVYQRLREHQETLWLQGAEVVLGRLAAELESPELQIFLARLEMARHGRFSYEQVLENAVNDAVRENRKSVETEIEGAPLRLLLPMLFLLFPPVLVLVLYPPAYALISQLAGAGSGVIP